MKSSLAILLFVGLVLVFSSEATHDDFNILTPEGNYKDGSMYMWYPILTEIKKYTPPTGHKVIKNIIDLIEPLEKAFQKNDDQSLSLVIGEISVLYKKLVPFVTNKQLAEAVLYGGNVCEEISERTKTNSISLKEIAVFAKDTAVLMTSAME